MPRGRGGARQGTSGTAYGNRTDLNMPMSTVPGQDYGKAAAQQAAQRAVPMGASPEAPAASMGPAQAQGQPLPQPGSLPHLETTGRPNEPVTTGLPFGPGAGPEAMGPRFANLGEILSSAANDHNASGLAAMLASSAKSLGI